MGGNNSKVALSSLRWNYLGFVVRSGSNFLIGILLARLLGPKPFGQLAVVALVISIANLLADAGFSAALVQASEIDELQIRYVFTIQMLIAAALSLATALLSGFFSVQFHDPGVRTVILVMAPIFLLQAGGQTSYALMRREFEFKKIQTFQISSYLISYLGVGVMLAFWGAGVWSLVAAQLLQVLLFAGLGYGHVRHSIVPYMKRNNSSLFRFGAKVTVNNVANWGISNLDNAVVGHTYGPLGLGLYNRAFSLSNSISDGVVSTLQQVLLSSCSRAGGRLVPLQRAYLACMSGVALIILPTFWTMSACSESVIVGLYGEKWLPAAPLFRPLAFAISIHALMALAGPILASIDLVEREIRAQIATLILAIVCYLISARYSISCISWVVIGVYAFRFVMVTAPLLREIQLPWGRLWRTLAGPLAAATITASVAAGMDRQLLRTSVSPVPRLALLTMTAAATLGSVVILAGRFIISEEAAGALRVNDESWPRWARLLYKFAIRRPREDPSPTRQTPVLLATTLLENHSLASAHSIAAALSVHAVPTEVASPLETGAALRRLAAIFIVVAGGLGDNVREVVRRWVERCTLERVLRRHLNRNAPWIVYAQTPDAALAAMRLRERSNHRVVLMMQREVSEADEITERGGISRGDWAYCWLMAREKVILSRVDGVVFTSELAGPVAKQATPGARLSPSILWLRGFDPKGVPANPWTPEGTGAVDARLLHDFLVGEQFTSDRISERVLNLASSAL